MASLWHHFLGSEMYVRVHQYRIYVNGKYLIVNVL